VSNGYVWDSAPACRRSSFTAAGRVADDDLVRTRIFRLLSFVFGHYSEKFRLANRLEFLFLFFKKKERVE
jgi:hypothetical protein